MVPLRFDVTDAVRARRRSRPPTGLFVAGLVIGWALDVVAVVFVVHQGLGVLAAVLTGVVGYLLLPVPAVTLLREVWLRTHSDRAAELDRVLAEHVPALQRWVDERLGAYGVLPGETAVLWLLTPVPRTRADVLLLPPELATQVGGAAMTARHDVVDGVSTLRLVVLPTATVAPDGPEPTGR